MQQQFATCIADMNSVMDSYRAAGIKPYIVTLGDMTRESRWYYPGYEYHLRDYANTIKGFNAPIFNATGNHDLDVRDTGEFGPKQAWKDIIGPTYYSFNLGKAHYVVLDNTITTNGEGIYVAGQYAMGIPDDQFEWLEKDLATVADKTAPLFIVMHCPLYSRPGVNNAATLGIYMIAGHGQKLIDCLNVGFPNVIMVSGHTHPNSRYSPPAYPWLTTKHIAAMSGNLFLTGQPGWAGNHIAICGSPGGYQVYELDGKNIQWYFKGIGYDRNYQFRTYDRNQIHITREKYAPNATNQTLINNIPAWANPYHTPSSDNDVIIIVWGWETSWNIQVLEGSVPLNVERISTKDPLSIISSDMMAINNNRTMINDPMTTSASHFFRVRANSPTSTLHIKVTDRFGKVYEETMTRPKELTVNSK